MKKSFLFLFLFGYLSMTGFAQTVQKDWCVKSFEVGLNGTFNNHCIWELEPEFFYNPVKWIGIGAGIAYSGMIGSENYGGISADGVFRWFLSDKQVTYAFSFRPKIQWNSPHFYLDRKKEYALSVSVCPGLIIPIPVNPFYSVDYISNTDHLTGMVSPVRVESVRGSQARPVYYSCGIWINYHDDDRLKISAGYLFSDFDYYGGLRQVRVEGKLLDLKKKRMMHAFTARISYAF